MSYWHPETRYIDHYGARVYPREISVARMMRFDREYAFQKHVLSPMGFERWLAQKHGEDECSKKESRR